MSLLHLALGRQDTECSRCTLEIKHNFQSGWLVKFTANCQMEEKSELMISPSPHLGKWPNHWGSKRFCAFRGTFGEGGLFSSSEKEKVRCFLFRLSWSWARQWDSSLCVGEEDRDFFSDTSDSSSSSSCCSEVLSSLIDSSSTSSWSSSSSPPLPWRRREIINLEREI